MTDRDRVRAYYRGFAEWERLESPEDGAVELAVTLATIERHLSRPVRVLDIGGGPGRYALELAARGHRVTLADLSPVQLEIARERIAAAGPTAGRVEEIVEADACDLSRWPDGQFDAALSLGPFYHLTDVTERETAAGELARVVGRGGHVFVAAIPRLALLRRTIALDDERHRLGDGAWLRRLLEDGVFDNDVAGRFDAAYAVAPGELDALFGRHGFDRLELLSAESLSIGIEGTVGAVLRRGGAEATALLDVLIEHAGDEGLLGTARHLLWVGRRRPTDPPPPR